jgi:hypothetical protein
VDQKLKVYSKKLTVKYDLRANDYAERRLEIPERRGASLSLGLDAQKEIDRIVPAESGTADVLIDEQMRVIQIRGHAGLIWSWPRRA